MELSKEQPKINDRPTDSWLCKLVSPDSFTASLNPKSCFSVKVNWCWEEVCRFCTLQWTMNSKLRSANEVIFIANLATDTLLNLSENLRSSIQENWIVKHHTASCSCHWKRRLIAFVKEQRAWIWLYRGRSGEVKIRKNYTPIIVAYFQYGVLYVVVESKHTPNRPNISSLSFSLE